MEKDPKLKTYTGLAQEVQSLLPKIALREAFAILKLQEIYAKAVAAVVKNATRLWPIKVRGDMPLLDYLQALEEVNGNICTTISQDIPLVRWVTDRPIATFDARGGATVTPVTAVIKAELNKKGEKQITIITRNSQQIENESRNQGQIAQISQEKILLIDFCQSYDALGKLGVLAIIRQFNWETDGDKIVGAKLSSVQFNTVDINDGGLYANFNSPSVLLENSQTDFGVRLIEPELVNVEIAKTSSTVKNIIVKADDEQGTAVSVDQEIPVFEDLYWRKKDIWTSFSFPEYVETYRLPSLYSAIFADYPVGGEIQYLLLDDAAVSSLLTLTRALSGQKLIQRHIDAPID